MIVTIEQQEKILTEYVSSIEGDFLIKIKSFEDGMNSAFGLIDKILKSDGELCKK